MSGRKTCEWRKDDRDFSDGDILEIREWDPTKQEYTGRGMGFMVTDILRGRFGMPDGYVMMSLRRM